MLVSFEGIDGSGKSLQARRLEAHLRAAGRPTLLVREPGGTAVGEHIRGLVLGDAALAVDAFAELLLFSAARAQLVAEVVRPALQAGAVVVCDRFLDSTVAYQGGGRGVADVDWLDAFQRRVTGGIVPDRTYLLDVPLDVAHQRRARRADDRMEAAGPAFFDRVRSAYLALADREPGRVVVLDGTRLPEDLHDEIVRDVLTRLGGAAASRPAPLSA